MVDYSYDPDDYIWDIRDPPEHHRERYPQKRDPPRRRPDRPDRTGPDNREGTSYNPDNLSQAEWYALNHPGMYDAQGRRIQGEETRNGMTQAEWYANLAKMDVINDPSVKMTVPEKNAINDPKKVMTTSGKIVKMKVQRAGIYPPIKPKRTRKKSKMDRTMSTCLKMANARYRKKNGQLKKGKTMRDVMKLAHRLCRKHG